MTGVGFTVSVSALSDESMTPEASADWAVMLWTPLARACVCGTVNVHWVPVKTASPNRTGLASPLDVSYSVTVVPAAAVPMIVGVAEPASLAEVRVGADAVEPPESPPLVADV